jgi:hypothetical protein
MLHKQFEGASGSTLVRWALEYLEDHAGMLERSHTDEYGRIRPAETRAELKCVREWCQRARELLVSHDARPARVLDKQTVPGRVPQIPSHGQVAAVIGAAIADPLKRVP